VPFVLSAAPSFGDFPSIITAFYDLSNNWGRVRGMKCCQVLTIRIIANIPEIFRIQEMGFGIDLITTIYAIFMQ
jgi:hypothetical protein